MSSLSSNWDTQRKSPTTLYVKPVNKGNRYVPGKVHKEIEYSSSDDIEDDSDKEEESKIAK